MLSLLLSSLLGAAPIDPSTMELVFALDGAERQQAEAALVAKGADGVWPLVWALRLSGPAALAAAAADGMTCPALSQRAPRGGEGAGVGPARVLLRIARRDAGVRRQLASGGTGTERLAALVASWDDPVALDELSTVTAPAVWREDELRLLGALQQCGTMGMAMAMAQRGGAAAPADLAARLAPARKRNAALQSLRQAARPAGPPCVVEADAEALAATAGPVRVRSWGTSGDEFSLSIELGGAEAKGTPACALALYEALKKKDVLAPSLLTAVASHLPSRARALALLERDLDAYDQNEQPEALRTLLKNSRRLERLATLDPFARAHDAELLEAGLRAKDPLAVKHLRARLGCPAVHDLVRLLALLADKRAAGAEAVRIAEQCPEAAGSAVATLLELGDARWAKHLDAALADRFSRFALGEALREHWSPAVKARLAKVKPADDEQQRWLDDLRRRAEPGE
ncbi:MAG: hypothetical protein ACOZQL_00885 [Myxococcota bacterium]